MGMGPVVHWAGQSRAHTAQGERMWGLTPPACSAPQHAVALVRKGQAGQGHQEEKGGQQREDVERAALVLCPVPVVRVPAQAKSVLRGRRGAKAGPAWRW